MQEQLAEKINNMFAMPRQAELLSVPPRTPPSSKKHQKKALVVKSPQKYQQRPNSEIAFSDINGAKLSNNDENENSTFEVVHVSVFDEILYKVKQSEIRFKKGMNDCFNNIDTFNTAVDARLFDMDQKIQLTLKFTDRLALQKEQINQLEKS